MNLIGLVESNLMSSGEFSNAIITDHSGKEIWASSPGCASMLEKEREDFAALWKNKTLARKSGFIILGNKYMCKTIDDDNIVGAGVSYFSALGGGFGRERLLMRWC